MKVTKNGKKDAATLTQVGKLILGFIGSKVTIDALNVKLELKNRKIASLEKKIEKMKERNGVN